MGSKRDARDSARLPAVLPRTIGLFLGLCAVLVALALLAYESGKVEKNTAARMFFQPILDTLTKPAVSIPLASALIVLGTALFRRLWFDVQAARPGPIRVNDLTAASNITDADIPQLTALFRHRLMQMRLHAPDPIPGTTPTQDVLTMLDSEALDPKNPLAALVRILRVACPTHAYEVTVSLVYEPAAASSVPQRGVTAQVTRLPYEALPVKTAWASSWTEAIVQAADQVTAAILPRTVLSNRAPWEGWRQYPMPELLVHHFEMAQELTSNRRYDEALDHYYRALQLDPKNVDLRLHKGFVEEKLGLYLDAVATYRAACNLSTTSTSLYDRGAQRKRRASGAIARYRLAILLSGTEFAKQWRAPDTGSLRDQQRLALRDRLEPELKDLLRSRRCLKRKRDADDPPGATGKPRWPQADVYTLLDEKGTNLERYYELRNVLMHLARRELEALDGLFRWRVAPKAWLTPLSIKLTIASVDVRLDYLHHKLRPEPGWKLDPRSKLPPTGRVRRTRTWTQRYNTAALYALPLLVEKELIAPTEAEDKDLRKELTKAAVEQLKLAMSSSVSWYAAQRRDWVLSEDPDLEGLRRQARFKQFEALYFPSSSRIARRPRNLQTWEQSRYTNALLSEAAQRWESVWHRRRDALGPPSDPHVVIQWAMAEADAWRLVEHLAQHYEHWPVRHDLIARMKEWSARYDFSPIEVEVPPFCPPPQSDDDSLDEVIETEIAHIADRLDAVRLEAGKMNGNGHGSGYARSQFDRLQDELRNRDFWHRPTPKLYMPTVCDVHAAMWQRLREWLEAAPGQSQKARSEFVEARRQAGRLSGTVNGMWFVAVVQRRVHLMTSGDRRIEVAAANGAQPDAAATPAAAI